MIQVNNPGRLAMNIVVVLVCFFLVSMAFIDKAPTARVGLASTAQIVNQLPQWAAAQAEADSFKLQLNKELEIKINTYNERQKDFQEKQETLNEVIREDKMLELQNMQAAIEKFQQTAREAILEKEAALFNPLLAKVKMAIEKAAKLRGYTHVFNTDTQSMPVVLYADQATNLEEAILELLLAEQTTTPGK